MNQWHPGRKIDLGVNSQLWCCPRHPQAVLTPRMSIIDGPCPPHGFHDECVHVSTDNNAVNTRSTALHRPWSFPLCPFVPLIVSLCHTPSSSPAMSPSPSLPWDVIERVVDLSAKNTQALKNLTLTCRDLRPRSTFLLLACVTLKTRNQLLNLFTLLQTKARIQPFVRLVSILTHEFSPYALPCVLPILSEIDFVGSWPADEHSPTFHACVLKYSHPLGQNIHTLSLFKLRLSSLSVFLDILLLLPRIESLSCEGLSVEENCAHEELITMRCLTERLCLKALTVSFCLSHRLHPALRILIV